jgi:predicted AlkP superfamily phosphohydrolase/phosphomutase
MNNNQVLIIGLDCLTPQLLFDRWLDELPTFKKLMQAGIWGPLESTIPCITVPAWTTMVTGKDPGELGFYGFRNRRDYTYDKLFFANAKYVKHPTLWNILSRNRKNSIILGVPQTYPPKPLRGIMVSSFLTPDENAEYTYPLSIKQELNEITGGYIIDVKEFRTEKKQWLLDQINQMTDKRFKVIKNWLHSKPWDLFMFVEMGPDRIHHGFWRYSESDCAGYVENSKFADAIKNYYIKLDTYLNELLSLIPEGTTLFVVSDHGAKSMKGGFCINEWLIQKGLLTIKEYPTSVQKLTMDNIDWEKTSCWGEGGYYARLFFNVKDREPFGTIPAEDYEWFRNNLKTDLQQLIDKNSQPINSKVFVPGEIYAETNGIPPDLIVYLGNLDYRSVGSIGYKDTFTFENDTGPDDANHDQYGIFIKTKLNDLKAGKTVNDKRNNLSIYDIAPTVLHCMNISSEQYKMRGDIIK